GRLFITGHKRTVIEVKKGLRVYPEELEALLTKIPYVRDSIVTVGESEIDSRESAVCACVSLYRDELAAKLGEGYTEEQVRDLLWEEIDGINDQIPSYKRIKRVVIDEH
ncbi:MAG: long-chain fatty acid--CoA ligase, partial [Clostridia bacterium]|nr:long-chain fatty acid--CoA ligase [Clostridia bacterium]